jgi:NADPH:quinone reductase-like Zn-dependent oxidoreductase
LKAIVIREFGGPEVLRWEEVPTPTPGPEEVLVRRTPPWARSS